MILVVLVGASQVRLLFYLVLTVPKVTGQVGIPCGGRTRPSLNCSGFIVIFYIFFNHISPGGRATMIYCSGGPMREWVWATDAGARRVLPIVRICHGRSPSNINVLRNIKNKLE